MKTSFKKDFRNTLRLILLLVGVILIVAVFALIPKIFSSHDMLYQTIAVVLSVIFTAIVTNQLLTGQSSNEEAREKNIKVHENKIAVYADFVSKMWATMNDGQVEPSEIVSIRSEVFNKLIFYLNDSQVKAISGALGELKEDSSDQEYIGVFQEITKTLRDDIMENASKSEGNDILTLWNRFNELLPKPAEEVPIPQVEAKDDTPAQSNTVVEKPVVANRSINGTCVHFNMLSEAWQYKIFANGAHALALCEYGESWRTNLVKRCGYNDVVFLYKTGGPGYVGAFLAKGWIVFEADGHANLTKVVECVFSEKSKNTAPVTEAEWQRKIDLYDVQDYIDDGCTLISYLIVEPLIYYAEGVQSISVYRRTISAYDNGYAWKTLARFKSILETEPKEDINTYYYNNETKHIQTNEEALQKLFADNNIVSSKWDSKVGWIDE